MVDILREETDGAVIFHLKGDLDLMSFSGLDRAVKAEVERERLHLVLEMSGVAFVDSSGFGCLITMVTNLRKSGGDLKLCRLNKTVLTVMRLSRITTLFRIHEDKEAALNEFRLAV